MPPATDASAPPKHAWSLPDRPTTTIGVDGGAGPGGVPLAPLFSPWEAEQRVDMLREFDVAEVGGPAWIQQHEALEQLNLQAHQSAQAQGDEFVLEALVTFDKVRVLVHELLAVEAWRQHLFPRLKQPLAELKATMRGYFCCYHEATLVNLLGVVLHHAHATEVLGDGAVELVDFVARRLVELNAKGREWSARGAAPGPASTRELAEQIEARTSLQELEEQADEVRFQVCVGCTTLARYLCEHLNSLPLTVMTRVLDTHDLLLLLVPAIENPPWTRRLPATGQWQKLVDNRWTDVAAEDLLTLTKTEAQLWLGLFALVCNAEVRKRYHFNSFRKNQLLRARKYINEVLLDQLPVLADVQRFMDELALVDAPAPTAEQQGAAGGGRSVLVMEQVPVTRERLVRQRDWDALAREQIETIFSAQTDATDADLRRLVDSVYALDGVEDVLGESPAAELYAQDVAALDVVLMGTNSAELARFSYTMAGPPKPLATGHGAFLRRKFTPPANAAGHPALGAALAEGQAVALKTELSFVGATPFNTALGSDPLDLAGKGTEGPCKEWCQLGALKDKLAVQVQLVCPAAGQGFHVGPAFVSSPAPFS